MRIDMWRTRQLVLLLAGGASLAQIGGVWAQSGTGMAAPPTIVVFNSDDFNGQLQGNPAQTSNASVFQPPFSASASSGSNAGAGTGTTTTSIKTFRFGTNTEGVVFGTCYIRVNDSTSSSGTAVGPSNVIATGSPSSVAGLNNLFGMSLRPRQQSGTDTPATLNVTTSVGPTGMTSGSLAVDANSLPQDAWGKNLYIELDWSQGGVAGGRSFSRVFTFVGAGDAAKFNDMPQFNNPTPFAAEVDPPTGTSSSPGASDTTTVATSSVTPGGTSEAGGSARASPSGGLSKGAIAGIAVGSAVAGLALIAGLVWCAMVRRRRSAGYSDAPISPAVITTAPYGSDRHGRTAELIAEKEATAGVAESQPHSPYSDDGQGAAGTATAEELQELQHQHQQDGYYHGAGSPVGVAGHDDAANLASVPMIRCHSDRSYTLYSDQQRQSQTLSATEEQEHQTVSRSRSAAGSPSPAGQQQQGVPGRYAHLMEEGMTADEMARLEEEERELDAAIAQAGRR